jgi:DNA modification methylase
MVAVFREVRRVLRPDGTCWVNMGDSYASGVGMARDQPYQRHAPQKSGLWKGTRSEKRDIGNNGVVKDGAGLKPKDLLLMPARLALALQADGWWVRSDIIWHKPNPMPESVTDRPTSAHEHVFLITKSNRYYYDADAVREEQSEGTIERFGNGGAPRKPGIKQGGSDRKTLSFDESTPEAILPNGRSCRNVWTIATAPYSQAHFATYPPALAERCIKAGTSERGCCSQCGKPWQRITERSVAFTSGSGKAGNVPDGKHAGAAQALSGEYDIRMGPSVASTTTGWRAGCDHGAPVVPCTVLDPFAGAGTTLLVADRLQRDAIGVELNVAYTEMAMERVRADAPLLHEMGPVPEHPVETEIADLFAEAAV